MIRPGNVQGMEGSVSPGSLTTVARKLESCPEALNVFKWAIRYLRQMRFSDKPEVRSVFTIGDQEACEKCQKCLYQLANDYRFIACILELPPATQTDLQHVPEWREAMEKLFMLPPPTKENQQLLITIQPRSQIPKDFIFLPDADITGSGCTMPTSSQLQSSVQFERSMDTMHSKTSRDASQLRASEESESSRRNSLLKVLVAARVQQKTSNSPRVSLGADTSMQHLDTTSVAHGQKCHPGPVLAPEGAKKAGDYYEVERLLKRRVRKRGRKRVMEYEVKWAGYDESFNIWGAASDITSEAISEFERLQEKAPKSRLRRVSMRSK